MRKARGKANRLIKGRRVRRKFNVGDRVWVWDMSREGNLGDKLKPWWVGPAILDEMLATSIWRVKLVGGEVCIFHVDHIRPYAE